MRWARPLYEGQVEGGMGPGGPVGRGKVWSSFWFRKIWRWLRCYNFFISVSSVHIILGGGFKYFLFSPLLGEVIQFDEYFQMG